MLALFRSFSTNNVLLKEMNHLFVQKINPILAKMEWVPQDENYDYHQEIARSAFADMLHDSERNQLYYKAIKLAIEQLHREGKEAHVLDIGTGTGLLSMMAAKCQANSIFACEAFKPMAQCAKKIIKENGFENLIKIIGKRSTELTVGANGDIPRRANLLVTEVFDTELIGEGALETFIHAHKELLEPDCLVVPSSANIYIQVVESSLAQRWNKPSCVKNSQGEILLRTPEEILRCPGAAAVHDIQLSQFPENEFKTILKPHKVFHFDWKNKIPLKKQRSSIIEGTALSGGKAQIAFMWWDLVMDQKGEIVLTCAPKWAHPLGSQLPWRDHWMQGLYYFPEEVNFSEGDPVVLSASHDEFSLWFSIETSINRLSIQTQRPVCDCGLHLAICRTRVGAISDQERQNKYIDSLSLLAPGTVCLTLGDGCWLGLAAAKLGSPKVYAVEECSFQRCVLEYYIKENRLEDRFIILKNIEDLPESVSLILSEPYYLSTLLPWHNIRFWFEKQQRNLINIKSVPCTAELLALPVEFDNLWKIRAPLKICEGFNMDIFDELVKSSSKVSDERLEPQPLWEYPCRALSSPKVLASFNLNESIEPQETTCRLTCLAPGKLHSIVVWLVWVLEKERGISISTGPIIEPIPGQRVTWDMHSRQGVFFFEEPRDIKLGQEIQMDFKFDSKNCSFLFDFLIID